MRTATNDSTIDGDKNHRIQTIAALYENEFSIDSLMELTGFLASETLSGLDEGIRSSWITSKGPGVYLFADESKKKELLSALSDKEIKRYHKQIAEKILQLAKGDISKERAATYHLLRSTNDLKGCQVLSAAGDAYGRTYQDRLALECYGKVIQDLPNTEGKDADHLFVNTIIKYSRIYTGEDDPEWIISLLKKAIRKAEEMGLDEYKSLLLMHIAKNEWFRGRFELAAKYFEDGWKVANSTENAKVINSAIVFKLFFSHWQGRFRDVVAAFETLVPEVDRYPKNRTSLLAALAAGQCYVRCGRVSHGLGMLDSLFKHREKVGDFFGIGQVGNGIGAVLIEIGRLDDAIKYLEKAENTKTEVQTIFTLVHRHIFLSLAYLMKKDIKKSEEHLHKFLALHGNSRMSPYPDNHLLSLSWAMGKEASGRHDALNLSKLIENCVGSQNMSVKGAGYRYLALAEKSLNLPPQKIVQLFQQSLQFYEEAGNVILSAIVRLELAREYQLMGNNDKAREIAEIAAQVLLPVNPDLIPKDLSYLTRSLPNQETVLDKILKLGQEFVTIRENRELVLHILSTSNQITGAERGAIFFLDKGKEPFELKLKASKNISAEDVSLPSFSRAMEIIQKTAASGIGCMMSFPPEDSGSISSGSILSCFCVPMIFKDKIIGVLYHDNCLYKNSIEELDLNVLSFFAAQAAIALDNARAYEEVQRLNEQLIEEKDYFKEQHLKDIQHEGIVGNSQAIRNVFNQVDKVAPEDTTILILGETGVGKELVARLMHQMSKRKEKSFIRVDCSALSETLIVSELFGHEKGSFTGASKRRAGRFELANGGTLFLDEIGNISTEIQVRLLRVLQTKEFQRVGGEETIRSDFRLLTATNNDLQKEVKAGRFREDLYYRLNIFPITVPPLRERQEDIPLLTNYFLKKISTQTGKPLLKVSKKTMDNLVAYSWPGNVRELENVIERGAILSTGSHLNIPQLAADEQRTAARSPRISLEENERRHILWALEETEGKIRGNGGAAELLDIHHNTLRSRMKKLGIKANKRTYMPDTATPIC